MEERSSRGLVRMSAAGAAFAVFIFSALTAAAYPAGSPPPAGSVAPPVFDATSGAPLNSLTAPFQNFANSIQSNNGISAPFSAIPVTAPRTAFQSVDGWFVQTIGVSLSSILHAILSVLQWVLDLAKRIVDWLLTLF